MPRPRIDMRKIREVLRLALGQQLSRRQVAAASGVALTTVSDYLSRAAAAPSLMTSSGEGSPRPVRSVRKSCQAPADSPEPGARPLNAGLPSVVMPQAASTGSAGEPGCIRKNEASRYR